MVGVILLTSASHLEAFICREEGIDFSEMILIRCTTNTHLPLCICTGTARQPLPPLVVAALQSVDSLQWPSNDLPLERQRSDLDMVYPSLSHSLPLLPLLLPPHSACYLALLLLHTDWTSMHWVIVFEVESTSSLAGCCRCALKPSLRRLPPLHHCLFPQMMACLCASSSLLGRVGTFQPVDSGRCICPALQVAAWRSQCGTRGLWELVSSPQQSVPLLSHTYSTLPCLLLVCHAASGVRRVRAMMDVSCQAPV